MPGHLKGLAGKRFFDDSGLEVILYGIESSVFFPTDLLKIGQNVGIRLSRDDRNVLFNDAGFLFSDGVMRIAKPLRVIETDVGDNRDARGDDVSGVVSAA